MNTDSKFFTTFLNAVSYHIFLQLINIRIRFACSVCEFVAASSGVSILSTCKCIMDNIIHSLKFLEMMGRGSGKTKQNQAPKQVSELAYHAGQVVHDF